MIAAFMRKGMRRAYGFIRRDMVAHVTSRVNNECRDALGIAFRSFHYSLARVVFCIDVQQQTRLSFHSALAYTYCTYCTLT